MGDIVLYTQKNVVLLLPATNASNDQQSKCGQLQLNQGPF